jgi:hypothetical protein
MSVNKLSAVSSMIKINSDALLFPSDLAIEYPMAPMASVKMSSDQTTLFIRVVVFIDAAFSGVPTVITPILTNGTLYCTVQYTCSNTTPTKFIGWFSTFDYPASGVIQVETLLENTDPKTSRGTVTTVLK